MNSLECLIENSGNSFLTIKMGRLFFTYMITRRLLVDIGNTHTVVGLYDKSAIVSLWRLQTDINRTVDEYWSFLNSLSSSEGYDLKETGILVLSCVVPKLTGIFRDLSSKYLNCQFVNVTSDLDLGLTYPTKDPSYIGADLLVDAFAVLEKYKTNSIVCDLGSATTIQLVGSDGYFYGTVISPGLITSSDSLTKTAAQLTEIKLSDEMPLLGKNTRDAVLSGIIRGHALMIDGFVSQIREEFSTLNPIKVVATGGIAKLVSRFTRFIDVVDETLMLDGLNRIAERQSR